MAKSSIQRKRLTRREQQDLDLEIQFVEGIVRRDPGYLQALQVLGDDYTRRGRYTEGLEVDERLARLNPHDALVHYNLACSYSLTSQCEAAVAALEKAIALGYRDFRWLAKDPDLEQLRHHPLYKRLRKRIRAMQIPIP
jgi:tetratricopeptide (TPR) repeat protein